jgi:hypothetical protein
MQQLKIDRSGKMGVVKKGGFYCLTGCLFADGTEGICQNDSGAGAIASAPEEGKLRGGIRKEL